MKHYQVEIKETLSTTIIIEAQSEEDALDIAKAMYDEEGITLSADDFMEVEFGVIKGTIGRYGF